MPASQPVTGPGADVASLFGTLAPEIRRCLDRTPDAGDLLVILASLPESLVGRTFEELRIDEAALNAALERARAVGPDSIEERIDQIRAQKDEALESQEFETAVRLLKEERRLVAERDADLVARIRARLGLDHPETEAESAPEAEAGQP